MWYRLRSSPDIMRATLVMQVSTILFTAIIYISCVNTEYLHIKYVKLKVLDCILVAWKMCVILSDVSSCGDSMKIRKLSLWNCRLLHSFYLFPRTSIKMGTKFYFAFTLILQTISSYAATQVYYMCDYLSVMSLKRYN